ncbi:MAG: YceI family protein [Ferruginibacter sp.]
MKHALFAVTALLISAVGFSQASYTPTDAGSKVHFTIKNFAIKTGGDFKGLTGAIKFDPAKLTTSNFAVSVVTSTIDTDSEMRDDHLKEDDYFDVVKYPLINFKSIRITTSGVKGRFYMFGNLTIKGITKPVEFGFSATPSNGGYLFDGTFDINRLDFKVGEESISLQDKVTIALKVFAKK